MKQARFFWSLIAAVLILSSVLAQQDDEVRADIEGIPQQWAAAYNQGDLASVADLYTEDAMFFASNGDVFESPQSIRGLFQGFIDRGAIEATIELLEMEIFGDTAYAIGSQRFMNAEGQLAVEGYSLLILKRVDGEWKIHRQLANRRIDSPEAGVGEVGASNCKRALYIKCA